MNRAERRRHARESRRMPGEIRLEVPESRRKEIDQMVIRVREPARRTYRVNGHGPYRVGEEFTTPEGLRAVIRAGAV